jgi:sulfur carrier protein ThiS
LKAQLIEVEKPQTVEELLKSKGLNPSMYIVSENGKIKQANDALKAGAQVKVVPAIKGGR